MEQVVDKARLCFFCAAVYEAPDGPVLQCPCCGGTIPRDTYEGYLRDAREAVEYGWNYRRRYEADLRKNGRITCHYALAEYEEAVHFLALAAVSGIVGGLAYDVVKKAMVKIIDTVAKKEMKHTENSVLALIRDRKKLDQFIQYVSAYYACFDSMEEEVQRAVMEEMLVDKLSPTLEQQLLSANPNMDVEEMKDLAILSDEEIFRGMLEVRRDIQRRYRLGPEDFQDFWKNVDQRRADGYGQETAPEEEGAQP